MKNYEKPSAVLVQEISEGIYASSGDDSSSDCWSVSASSVQDWNGSHHVFEVKCKHSGSADHNSSATTVKLQFSAPLTDAYSEFTTKYSGNSVTVVRTLHANGSPSGDTVTYKVWVKASDEATTKGLSCLSSAISCTKS